MIGKKSFDNIHDAPQTKTRDDLSEIKEQTVGFSKEKKTFERDRNKEQKIINKAKTLESKKKAEISKLQAEIDREKNSLASVDKLIENYKAKNAGKQKLDFVVSMLESKRDAKKIEFDSLKLDKEGKINELNNDIEENNKEVIAAEGRINALKSERKTKIEEKISSIEERYGRKELEEGKNTLREDIEKINKEIQDIKENELQPYREVLAVFKKDSDFQNLVKEVEDRIKALQSSKEEALKRIKKIDERLTKINSKTAKWKALIGGEGLRNIGKEETPETTNTTESIPDDDSESSTEGKENKLEGVPGITAKEILESATAGIGIDGSGEASGSSETEPDTKAENKELPVEERIAQALDFDAVRNIIDSLEEDDLIFSGIGKMQVLLNLSLIEAYSESYKDDGKDWETLKTMPEMYGLKKKMIKLLEEESDKQNSGDSDEPQEAAPVAQEPEAEKEDGTEDKEDTNREAIKNVKDFGKLSSVVSKLLMKNYFIGYDDLYGDIANIYQIAVEDKKTVPEEAFLKVPEAYGLQNKVRQLVKEEEERRKTEAGEATAQESSGNTENKESPEEELKKNIKDAEDFDSLVEIASKLKDTNIISEEDYANLTVVGMALGIGTSNMDKPAMKKMIEDIPDTYGLKAKVKELILEPIKENTSDQGGA